LIKKNALVAVLVQQIVLLARLRKLMASMRLVILVLSAAPAQQIALLVQSANNIERKMAHLLCCTCAILVVSLRKGCVPCAE
jgi:hypothetical protein